MRTSARDHEREANKRLSIPITVRQLESIVSADTFYRVLYVIITADAFYRLLYVTQSADTIYNIFLIKSSQVLSSYGIRGRVCLTYSYCTPAGENSRKSGKDEISPIYN